MVLVGAMSRVKVAPSVKHTQTQPTTIPSARAATQPAKAAGVPKSSSAIPIARTSPASPAATVIASAAAASSPLSSSPLQARVVSELASSPQLSTSPSSFFFNEAMKNSDEASFSYDSDDEGGDSDSDELNYFHDSPPTSTSDLSKRDNPRHLRTAPFWFSKEEDEQVIQIVALYERFLDLSSSGDSALSPAKRKTPTFKLPTFIGRIIREATNAEGFVTLDTVELYRHDLRLIGSNMTLLGTKYLLTTWELEDGLPCSWSDLTSSPHEYEQWQQSRNLACDVSYINRLPVWGTRTYKIIVENSAREIGYAGGPFHYTPFIPQEWTASFHD